MVEVSGVGDLVLDDLRRLTRIACADDDLHVGEIGQASTGVVRTAPMPIAVSTSAARR
jgi:hypothetical protein